MPLRNSGFGGIRLFIFLSYEPLIKDRIRVRKRQPIPSSCYITPSTSLRIQTAQA